ncbi:MAG: FAD-dependent oxidoreductase, partial [Chloroflexi bacterium]|nr:FAD-dependent oxidoreductase [Chloroflexota bacterium]
RTDEYGGGFEGFLRFPLEIVKRARELVGPDFPLVFRISADEVVPLGRTVPESLEMMQRLIQAGINAVDVSIGVPESSQYTSAPPDMKQGFNAETSVKFKQAFNVPILVAGRINDPSTAVGIIKSGKADLVHIGRQSLTDPEWPNKVKEGRIEDIVRCLSCNEGCIEGLATWLRPSITCVQNLALGREEAYSKPRVAQPKKVLIAGGGPGGLEAARTAALRGHSVSLFEQDGYLGGQTRLVAIPPGKEIYREVAQSRIKAIKELGVDIHVGQRLTAAKVKEIKPDVLIIATGSEPAILNIPGVNHKNVMSARKALTSEEAGDNVLVIGGGLVGCETADYLASKGKNVTIVEMLKHTARDIGPAARFFLRKRLKERNVKILTQTAVKSISEDGVVASTPVAEEKLGPFDTVVLASGATAVNELGEQVKGLAPEIYIIGDAAKPGKILAAVEQAAEIALKL